MAMRRKNTFKIYTKEKQVKQGSKEILLTQIGCSYQSLKGFPIKKWAQKDPLTWVTMCY
jgi:hypothetical protein